MFLHHQGYRPGPRNRLPAFHKRIGVERRTHDLAQHIERKQSVTIYDVPRVFPKPMLEFDPWAHMPGDAAGAFFSPLSRAEYERLTFGRGGPIAASS